MKCEAKERRRHDFNTCFGSTKEKGKGELYGGVLAAVHD